MHPEITRAMVYSQQVYWGRPSVRLAAQLRADLAASRRPVSRRRRLRGSVRAALRVKPVN
jgi:hypothetical protein